jgi:hypothetical protein
VITKSRFYVKTTENLCGETVRMRATFSGGFLDVIGEFTEVVLHPQSGEVLAAEMRLSEPLEGEGLRVRFHDSDAWRLYDVQHCGEWCTVTAVPITHKQTGKSICANPQDPYFNHLVDLAHDWTLYAAVDTTLKFHVPPREHGIEGMNILTGLGQGIVTFSRAKDADIWQMDFVEQLDKSGNVLVEHKVQGRRKRARELLTAVGAEYIPLI